MLRLTLQLNQPNKKPTLLKSQHTEQVNSSTIITDESKIFLVKPTCDLAQGKWFGGLKINLRKVVFEFENLINLEEDKKLVH